MSAELPSFEELAALVVELWAEVGALRTENAQLRAKNAELRARLGKNRPELRQAAVVGRADQVGAEVVAG